MFERMDPKTLIKWLIVAALVYLVVPYDLIPDFLGLPGRLDDLLMMVWLAWLYRNHANQYAARGTQQSATGEPEGSNARQGASSSSRQATTFNPYEVLGIVRGASKDAIRSAYRERMMQYHPDKVAHLGEELQALANEKSQQIQRAYRELQN